MTTPDERYRALLWAREFLRETMGSESTSTARKREAVVILRHFPGDADLAIAALRFPSWLRKPDAEEPP